MQQVVTANGTTTTTNYIGGYEDVSTTNGVTTTTKYYDAGVAQAVNVNGTLSYLVQDSLGSVAVALDNAGNVTAAQLYFPYGGVRYATGTMPTSFGFTGQRLDPSGLMYFHARYYDPTVGQFISADPVQGPNRYDYVGGNPASATDPSGLTCTSETPEYDCGGGAAEGGGAYLPPPDPEQLTTTDQPVELVPVVDPGVDPTLDPGLDVATTTADAVPEADPAEAIAEEQQILAAETVTTESTSGEMQTAIDEARQARETAQETPTEQKPPTAENTSGNTNTGNGSGNAEGGNGGGGNEGGNGGPVQPPETLNPQGIGFTQSSIAPTGPGYTVQGNIEALQADPNLELPPIRVFVKTPAMDSFEGSTKFGPYSGSGLFDDQVYTLDNRRLYAYQMAGRAAIPIEWADYNTVWSERYKFTTPTWGVDIVVR